MSVRMLHCMFLYTAPGFVLFLVPVVQKVNNAINLNPVDSAIVLLNTYRPYLLDSDLCGG